MKNRIAIQTPNGPPGGQWKTGQKGFALVAVLVILVALTLVGGAAAVMTRTEVKVAGLYNFSNRASAAAAAGLEHATAHLSASGADDGWPVEGEIGGYEYEVTIGRDSFDFGAGIQPVSWSVATGFNGDGDGEPVWLLTSTATRDPYVAVQRLRVGSETFDDVGADAPFQANSSVTLRGTIKIDGRNRNIDGSLVAPPNNGTVGACDESKAAIKLSDDDDEVDKQGSGTLLGNPVFLPSSPPFIEWDDDEVFYTPEEALGLPPGTLDRYAQTASQFYSNRPDTLSGVTYLVDGFGSKAAVDADGNAQGTGIVIVHNPLYDPRDWDPDHPQYSTPEAAAKRADPGTYGPAELGNINGGTFKGVIVADKVNKIDGDITIYGSVMSLSGVDENTVGAGTATLYYSCQAIEALADAVMAVQRLAWVAE